MSNTDPIPPTPPETSPPTSPPAPSLDKKKQAETKIVSIETQLKSFEGKSGYNPFTWKRDNDWDRLVLSAKKGDTVAITKILALPATIVPKVVNEVVFTENFGSVKAPFAPTAPKT